MSRYLCELKNLLTDLKDRCGEGDDSVQQVKRELDAVEARESGHQSLFAHGRDRLLRRSGRHSWEGYSSPSARPSGLGAAGASSADGPGLQRGLQLVFFFGRPAFSGTSESSAPRSWVSVSC